MHHVIFIAKCVPFLQSFSCACLKNQKKIKEEGKCTHNLAHTMLLLCCCLFWDGSHSTTQRAWDQATQLLSKTKRLLSRETREVFIPLHLFSFVSCLLEMLLNLILSHFSELTITPNGGSLLL